MKIEMEFQGLQELMKAFEDAARDEDIRAVNKKIVEQGEQLFVTCIERIRNWQVKQEQPINLTEIETKLSHVQEEWTAFKSMV